MARAYAMLATHPMPSDKRASRTALMVAAYRARASERDEPVCRDPWARALAGEEGEAIAAAYDASFGHMELWIAVRTAFIDDRVRRAIAAGVRQVAMLGAGFDTRAARLGQQGVRFFEIDHPESQREKLLRLRSLGGYPVEAATYVTCDFEHQDFLDRATAAGFRTSEPAFIVWEGVTAYLTEAAVRATFHRIATGCHPQSQVVFDHLRRKIVSGDVRAEDLSSREFVAELGEPLRFGTDDALPLLFEEGFRRVQATTFDQACLNLTGSYDRARMFKFQSLVVASVEGDVGP